MNLHYRYDDRGCHDRNMLHVPFAHIGFGHCWIEHEEKHPVYGLLAVVNRDWGWSGSGFHVVWRPSRNHTRYDIQVMDHCPGRWHEPVQYETLEDAKASLEHWKTDFSPPSKTRRRIRDSQKNKVYKWEWVMAQECSPETYFVDRNGIDTFGAALTLRRDQSYLQDFLTKVCDELGEKEPELFFRSGGRASYGSSWKIRLLPGMHRSELVLLHELAHCLHLRWCKHHEHQAHGKEYVGIYCYLLVRFAGVNEAKLRETLKENKVDYEFPSWFYNWRDGDIDLREAANVQ